MNYVKIKLSLVWSFLKKLKIELPYNLAILLLALYLQNTENLIQKDERTPMFTVALLIIAKICTQPKYSPTDEQMKMWING